MILQPPFYLTGREGNTLGLDRYSLAALGITDATLKQASLEVGELTFTQRAKPGRVIPDDNQWITLLDDAGTALFKGLAKRTFSYKERLYNFTVSDTYKGLMETPLLDADRAFVLYGAADLGSTVLDRSAATCSSPRLPTLDFHTQFYPFLLDYYQFGLNGRTDHDLEGWQALGHVINEYTTIPGSGHFFDEETFLKLPMPSQIAIRSAAQDDPSAWSRRRNLSPGEVWDRRPKFLPIPPTVLCDMLGSDLAREVTARRGFLEFSDQAIACDPLIYQARFISGPRHGREIPHGEKCKMFVLPFDDATAIIVDAKDRYLGEVPLYKRVLPIDPDVFGSDAPFESRPDIRSHDLQKAAGEKHSRIADILEPSRILHADRVQDARNLREHNRRVISGEPVTEAERRAAGALQAPVTAAANRLQKHGQPIDWDNYQPDTDTEIRAAWDDLPDDVPLPDAL